jgi:hypothetical protein
MIKFSSLTATKGNCAITSLLVVSVSRTVFFMSTLIAPFSIFKIFLLPETVTSSNHVADGCNITVCICFVFMLWGSKPIIETRKNVSSIRSEKIKKQPKLSVTDPVISEESGNVYNATLANSIGILFSSTTFPFIVF